MLSSHSHQSPLFIRCNQRIGFRDLPPWAGHSKSSTVHPVQPTNRFQGLATLGWTQQVVVFCHFCMNGPKYWPANIKKLRNFQHHKFWHTRSNDQQHILQGELYSPVKKATSTSLYTPSGCRLLFFRGGNQNVLQRRVAYLYIFAQREVIICNSSVQQRTKDEPIG
jgi:hypothetical protein